MSGERPHLRTRPTDNHRDDEDEQAGAEHEEEMPCAAQRGRAAARLARRAHALRPRARERPHPITSRRTLMTRRSIARVCAVGVGLGTGAGGPHNTRKVRAGIFRLCACFGRARVALSYVCHPESRRLSPAALRNTQPSSCGGKECAAARRTTAERTRATCATGPAPSRRPPRVAARAGSADVASIHSAAPPALAPPPTRAPRAPPASPRVRARRQWPPHPHMPAPAPAPLRPPPLPRRRTSPRCRS